MMVISACCSVTGITSPSTSKSWACPASPSSLSESHRSVPCLLAWTPFFPPPITTPSQIPERLFLLSSRSCCCCCCSGLVLCRCCSSWSLLIFVGFCFAVVVWMGPPAASIQSLLIQGRGKYNCSLDLPPGGSAASSSPDCLQCNATNPACAPFVLPVQPGKTYRLRIGSMATLSSLNFKIEVNPFSILRNFALPGLTEAFSDCKTLGSRAELHGLS